MERYLASKKTINIYNSKIAMMNQKPLITIVTTIYNDRNIIKRLLNSLLHQSMTNFVHLIYEDGSNVTSEDIVNEYAKKANELIKPYTVLYIKGSRNLGVNKAHEYCFQKITTPYFVWIDADDWVRKDYIRAINKYIKKYTKASFFHINSKIYFENGLKKPKTTKDTIPKYVLTNHDQFPAYCLGSERFWHHFVIKTDDFRKINPQGTIFELKNKEETLWYDAQILFELCFSRCFSVFIKKPLSCILERNNSVSRKKNISINSDETYKTIIGSLHFNKKDILFYNNMLNLKKIRLSAYKSLEDSDFLKAKLLINESKLFIKNHHLTKNYLLYEKSINYLYVRLKYRFLFKIKRFFQ